MGGKEINIAGSTGISRLSEFIAVHMGLHFPENRWQDLWKGICSAAEEFNFEDAESCMQWLISSPLTRSQVEILASHLTIGETYFLRDGKLFELLESAIIPEMIKRKKEERRLRIWSAGCATGEEPYSMAILLSKLIPDLRNWDITILATDINPRFLHKASAGIYNDWSFRDAPFWFREKYFRRTDEARFEVLPRIRKMVAFSYLNLAEDTYPSLLNNTNAMDIILCRNVLMYFIQDIQNGVIQKLHKCLVDGGYLIVSPSETSHMLFSQFKTVNRADVIFYQKVSTQKFISEPEPRSLIQETFGPGHKIFPPESGEAIPCESAEFSPSNKIEDRAIEPQIDSYSEGFALYKEGRYAEAESKVALLLTQNQNDPAGMMLLSRIYANQGKLAEAVRLCERAIAADKLNPGCHYLLANILQEHGRFEEAAASLKRSLYLDQNFVLAHFALGTLSQQNGRFKEAEKYFENALSLLKRCRREDILPESEGMTAGRLAEIIEALSGRFRVDRHKRSIDGGRHAEKNN